MAIAVRKIELRKIDLKTRLPFRYGIATVTHEPYLLVCAEFEVDGKISRGVAADVLPPKWFTKNAETSHEEEIADMLAVIRHAGSIARDLGEQDNVFLWWHLLYRQQMSARDLSPFPPLLRGFGISLLERTAIDAFCRRHEIPFAQAVRENSLGIRLAALHAPLDSLEPAELLPEFASATIQVRHTVGLSDPLTATEIRPQERLDDGLPQALEECLRRYRLTHLKIKLPANLDEARDRLANIASISLQAKAAVRFTLDGNEFFASAAAFREYWEALNAIPEIREYIRTGLLVVEQPLRRDVALSSETQEVFAHWQDGPPIIIDESDSEIESLSQAIQHGYIGTSHKNCKGVFKGIANGCLINYLNRESEHRRYVLTGEDLMNSGPVALLQDLAVGASLGLTHMERNGHHFFAGLQQFPLSVQALMLRSHGDLYEEITHNEDRFPSLRIEQGRLNLRTVNDAPFGYAGKLNTDDFQLIDCIE